MSKAGKSIIRGAEDALAYLKGDKSRARERTVSTNSPTETLSIILEVGAEHCSAHSPQIPGFVSLGDDIPDTLRMMAEEIELHLGRENS